MARPGGGRPTRLPIGAVTLLIALLAVSLIGISPLALGLFHGATTQWERLSFIGQTYGAASAVISVLALVGVVLTLIYQARETKRAREETRRQAIGDLLKMAMDDPDLDECWGPVPEPDDPKNRKQQLYTNMIVAAWEMSFEMGAIPEHRLRYASNEMFRGRVGREYWRNAREGRISTSANRRERRFHQILDEEYQKIVGPEDSIPSALESDSTPEPYRTRAYAVTRPLLLLVTGAGVALLIRRLLHRTAAGARLRPADGVTGGRQAAGAGEAAGVLPEDGTPDGSSKSAAEAALLPQLQQAPGTEAVATTR